MGIPLGGGNFTRGAAIPLDDSYVKADITARDAIDSGIRYEGMPVYVIADGLEYRLVGGILNANWVVSGGGGGGGSTPIVDLATGDGVTDTFTVTQDPVTVENVAVYIDGVRQTTAMYTIVGGDVEFVNIPYDGATLMFVTGGTSTVNVPAVGSVVTASIADGAVTYPKLAARSGFNNPAAIGEIARSASSGGFFHQNTTEVDVTNLSVTITTKGGPVELMLVDDESLSSSNVVVQCSTAGFPTAWVNFYRGATQLTYTEVGISVSGTYPISTKLPPSSFKHIDAPAAGTYTYKVRTQTASTTTTGIGFTRCKLIAKEI